MEALLSKIGVSIEILLSDLILLFVQYSGNEVRTQEIPKSIESGPTIKKIAAGAAV
ncbi:hypothetical protein [Flavonifractor sp. An91]|uniref:hypothetical protein n=1 Tax=Flavonifractor sp. An91 TaxID=1965665 RepID=UPI0013A64650|nr:hypothetical protein [Flavonifractor sp. An91]